MPSSALCLVANGATRSRDDLEPEHELEQLWRREAEIRSSLAVNFSLQQDAARRYREKHGLVAAPRIETLKAGIRLAAAKEAAR